MGRWFGKASDTSGGGSGDGCGAGGDGVPAAGSKVLSDTRRDELLAMVNAGGLAGRLAGLRLQRDDLLRRQADIAEVGTGGGRSVTPGRYGYTVGLGGAYVAVGQIVEARGTTDQVQGLSPFAVGAGSPGVGTPVGVNLATGEPVHIGLTDWKIRAGVITAPIAMVLALNGFGKSSLVRRLQAGAVAQGRVSLALGDCKPDYRTQTEAFGGQVIQVGADHGTINPLDVGAMGLAAVRMSKAAEFLEAHFDTTSQANRDAVTTRFGDPLAAEWVGATEWQRRWLIDRLRAQSRSTVLELRMRQTMMVASLIQLGRRDRISDFEESMIYSGIEALYGTEGFSEDNPPILADLYAVLCRPTGELIEDAGITPGRPKDPVTGQLSSEEEYLQDIKPLRRSLRALIRGEFGQVFNGQTSVRLDLSAPAIDVDISNIPQADASTLRAAVLLACWGDGFGAIEAAQRLADVGLGPRIIGQIIMDELWQVLQSSPAMVSKVNQLSRLNRQSATEVIMITHSIADFGAVSTVESRAEAEGLIERARVKIIGAVPATEIRRLREVVELSEVEAAMLTTWSSAGSGAVADADGGVGVPPGTGNFLIKVGERGTGVPFHMNPTAAEMSSQVHNTDRAYGGGSIMPPDPGVGGGQAEGAGDSDLCGGGL